MNNAMKENFHKKIFTAKIFFNDLGFLIIHFPMVLNRSTESKNQ